MFLFFSYNHLRQVAVTQLLFPPRLSLSHVRRQIKSNAAELVINAVDLCGGVIGIGYAAENPYVESIKIGGIHRYFSACAFVAYPLNRRVVSCSLCTRIPLQLHLQTCSKQHEALSYIPKKEPSKPRNRNNLRNPVKKISESLAKIRAFLTDLYIFSFALSPMLRWPDSEQRAPCCKERKE